MTLTVSLIAIAVTAASAIDACGVQEYSEYFGVSKVVASLATGTSEALILTNFEEYFTSGFDLAAALMLIIYVHQRSLPHRIRVRLPCLRTILRNLRP